MFVITDGAVADERDICNFMKSYAAKADVPKVPRVCTFGIGKYANHYFLKMLASIGRGHNSETSSPDGAARHDELLHRCKVPILTDIAVGLPSEMGAEVYPFPIPDLFAGAPVMISGKITGGLPPQVDIIGNSPTGRSGEEPSRWPRTCRTTWVPSRWRRCSSSSASTSHRQGVAHPGEGAGAAGDGRLARTRRAKRPHQAVRV